MAWVKALLLLSATLLATAGLLRWWLRSRPLLASLLAVAASLIVVAASAADIWFTLQRVVNVDWNMFMRYLTSTRHGDAVIWRTVIAALLLVVHVIPRRSWQVWLALPGWLLLLGTFSYTSHAAAMGGWSALLVDWVHFTAAGVWAGVILAMALARELWQPAAVARLTRVMRVVSATGLWSLLAVAASGTLSTLFHTGEPERFFGSDYSMALAIKIGLVAVAVLVAAFNRFLFLPRLESGGGSVGLRRSMLVESVVLVTVFVATGVLTTSELPHGQEITGPLENLRAVLGWLFR